MMEMLERWTSRKFQLTGLVSVMAILAPFITDEVPAWLALIVVAVVVCVYMIMNVLQKKWGLEGPVIEYSGQPSNEGQDVNITVNPDQPVNP